MNNGLIHWPDPLLAIETSCDETSAAVLVDGDIRANIISSQAELHKTWGGVVPEVAARMHVESILPCVEMALKESRILKSNVSAIAVTNRPGLIGALSVGVTFARAFASAAHCPLIGIHHLEGHIWSILGAGAPQIPFISLIVSGGHTELVLVKGIGDYEILGETIDDAAGEAYDKSARLLGFGYPGGSALADAAANGDDKAYALPTGRTTRKYDFSYSGLKTAAMRLIEKDAHLNISHAAASIQSAINRPLVEKSIAACEEFGIRQLTLGGGVSANEHLRTSLKSACERYGIQFLAPPRALCTDNAAMIGIAASLRLAKGDSSPISSLEPISSESIA